MEPRITPQYAKGGRTNQEQGSIQQNHGLRQSKKSQQIN